MKAKKGKEYLVLAGIQGIGAVLIYLHNYNWPETMSLFQACTFTVLLAIGILLFRLMWICISSYVINISKYCYYKITGEEIVSFCIWPFFWTSSKWSMANVFWVYDDRTCFSMNKYLEDQKGLKKLSAYLLKRNRVLLGIYLLFTTVVICLLFEAEMYSLVWLFFLGGIDHIVYQMDYKQVGSSDAMAFAGVNGIKVRLILHMLANQCRIEKLTIGKEVAGILSEEMYDVNGGYFFNYLCLSTLYNEICCGVENEMVSYMDEKVENIKNETPAAMKLVSGLEKEFKYKHIDKSICLFYANYREFLLYVLMYYKLKNRTLEYVGLNNYVRYMLDNVENKCVKNSILSEYILSSKFEEYKNLYQNVMRHEFTEETTIFTGYDTLPLWQETRSEFVKKFNGMNKE